MAFTSISIKEETLSELVKSKAKQEVKNGKSITWDEFFLALIKKDKDLEAFM